MEISGKPWRMARPKNFVEQFPARFPEGTFERMKAALREGEDRADFIREAVERELKRRAKAPKE
jgi:predicted DNA-binding protein